MALIDRWNALSNDGRAYIKFSAFLLYVYIYNRMPFYKSAKLLYCGMGSYIFISTYVLVTKLFFKRDNTPLLFIGMGIWQFFLTWFMLRLYWRYHDQDLIFQMSINFGFVNIKKKLIAPWWQYFAATCSYWMIKGWFWSYCMLHVQEDRDMGYRRTRWFWVWYISSWFPLAFYVFVFVKTVY